MRRGVRGRERAGWTIQAEQRRRHGYPGGFRCISDVLERLENWDKTLSL